MSKKTYLSAFLLKRKECIVCYDSYLPTWDNPCSNPGCTLDLCQNCIKKSYYLPNDHIGKIERRFVLCTICNVLINPLNPGISEFVSKLFAPHDYYENSVLVAKNAAELLLKGHNVWKCESKNCLGTDKENIFLVEKIQCHVIHEDDDTDDEINDDLNNDKNKKHLCNKCVEQEEQDMRTYLNEWNNLGFDIDHGLLGRVCPGCGNKCQRVKDTCARILCVCGTHYCYCCGEKFDSYQNVYNHLNAIYGTAFPTDEQIKEYLRLIKEIKDLKQGLPKDITNEEIVIMLKHEKIAEETRKKREEIRMEKLMIEARNLSIREARKKKNKIHLKMFSASSIKTTLR